MIFVETSIFTRQVQKLLSNEEYRQLQIEMATRPDTGAVIPGSGGIRKIRWRFRGQGKRGGVRVIYYWAVSEDSLLMLLIYPKNVQDNLSPTQLKALKRIVKEEYP
ncbi:MAG: type II toxin-antitoxin system RelE/ParE family toxin [Anaerolineae bacterium]